MNTEDEIKNLVHSIRESLPEAADLANTFFKERGFDIKDEFDIEDELHYLWVEALADATNSFIKQNRMEEVKTLLQFMSSKLNEGSAPVKNCLDVSYIENLMWDLDEEDQKRAWPLFPENLKALYIAMWGEPDF